MIYNIDPRKEIVSKLYRELLGREADAGGLETYAYSDISLEAVYMSLYTSEEAKNYRKELENRERQKQLSKVLPITLAMFVKDNEDSVAMAIKSVKPVVSEIVVVDTGSTDKTPEICKGLGARVYKIGFTDFGSIRTITGHLARQPWILGLDSDEVILEDDYDLLRKVIEDEDVDAWGLPRKRWLDLEMTTQLEKEVYPDFQYRLFRNNVNIYYKRRVHEVIAGTTRTNEAKEGPHIHHFQDVFKRDEKLKERNIQYKTLQKMDIEEGIKHTEKAVQELDER